MLGGWWAYEVLGWGGYWAWDPVENASFLPWLTATAALHSALLVERKGILKGWTATLVLATFLLTILGTFMTRSGVFNSVHSFTQSAIGPTILVFLAVALVFSVILLALRVDRLAAEGRLETGLSRDAMFLVQNLLFVLFTFTVLLGTVFPLVVEAVQGTADERGPALLRPHGGAPGRRPSCSCMGVGPALPWGCATREQVRKRARAPALRRPASSSWWAPGSGCAGPGRSSPSSSAATPPRSRCGELSLPVRQRMRARGEDAVSALLAGAAPLAAAASGAYVAHAGAVLIIGPSRSPAPWAPRGGPAQAKARAPPWAPTP